MGCLNCNIELNHTPGKRKKQFCSPDCRVRYWQKNKPQRDKEAPPKDEVWEQVKAKMQSALEKAESENNQLLEKIKGLEIEGTKLRAQLTLQNNKVFDLTEDVNELKAKNKPPTAPETEKEGKTTLKQEKGKEGAEKGQWTERATESNKKKEEMPSGLSKVDILKWHRNHK